MGIEAIIGKCGLYCGACTIYRAEKDDPDWRKRIADKFNCSSEMVKCNGCGELTSECWGNGCEIVLCTRAKGYSFCHECSEYEEGSCSNFQNLYNRYSECNVDLRNNLDMIKAGNIDEWYEKSSKQFTCKSCGKPTAAGAKRCHHCSSDI